MRKALGEDARLGRREPALVVALHRREGDGAREKFSASVDRLRERGGSRQAAGLRGAAEARRWFCQGAEPAAAAE